MIQDTLIKASVRKMIGTDRDHYEWTLQGLGMLRAYLSPEVRVHVWDYRYQVENVTMMHDHPWDFESYIVAGKVHNVRYVRTENRADFDTAFRFIEQPIICGEGGGECEAPAPVWLKPVDLETYRAGETYHQYANEIHSSHPDLGSITVIERTFRPDTETARVFYNENDGFVSAEPRAATPAEVADILDRSLSMWFS